MATDDNVTKSPATVFPSCKILSCGVLNVHKPKKFPETIRVPSPEPLIQGRVLLNMHTDTPFLSRLSPVPSFPAYSGPYTVGTQDVEIPISELSSSAPAPDPQVSTISFRLFYPCEPEKRAKSVSWLPEPQGEYLRAYYRFMQASPWLASLLRCHKSCLPIEIWSRADSIAAISHFSDSSTTPRYLLLETQNLYNRLPRTKDDGRS